MTELERLLQQKKVAEERLKKLNEEKKTLAEKERERKKAKQNIEKKIQQLKKETETKKRNRYLFQVGGFFDSLLPDGFEYDFDLLVNGLKDQRTFFNQFAKQKDTL